MNRNKKKSRAKKTGKSSPSGLTTAQKRLFEKAARARKNSYSPYSDYAVGAAIRLKGGKIYAGCNVENSTYGATTCAEQVAIFKAISEEGRIEIEEILVITESDPPAAPCGICRQVIAEFGPNARIHAMNPNGSLRSFETSDLLPEAFTPAHLDIRV